MINIHEKIKLALKKQGKSFEELEHKFYGKRTGNLSASIKKNQKVVPTLENCFEELQLDIIDRDELRKLRGLREFVKSLNL